MTTNVVPNLPAEAAIATLKGLGYTYHGGNRWKPPIGPRPDFKKDSTLPELPDAVCLSGSIGAYRVYGYTGQSMREYAHAAVTHCRRDTDIPASHWLPIDGAPKDGTWILVMFDHYPDTVRWQWEGWDNGAGRMMNPKYYMPIPPLPKVDP